MSKPWQEAESGLEPELEGREHVVLEGGPAVIARRWRCLGDIAPVVKIPHLGGYEHYHATGDQIRHGEQLLPVYRWTQRTRIAE